MSALGLVLLKLFFFIQSASCFVLMLVGIGMVEHVNNMVALAGGLLATVGAVGFVMFGVLLAREEV